MREFHAISPDARISRDSEIVEPVIIEAGAQILPGAFVQGPVYIGKNVLVGNSSLIRPGTFLSRDSIIGNHCYCTSAVLGPKSGVFHFCGVSRSLLERNCRLSAFVVTGTARPDLKPINRHFPKKIGPIPSKRGCIIGENTFIAPYVLTAPGVVIGSNCFIGPFNYVDTDVPPRTRLDVTLPVKTTENKLFIAELLPLPKIPFKR